MQDSRFGVAEYDTGDMAVLGFDEDGRYHARQWTLPEDTNSTLFLRPASRSHTESTWCIGAYRFAGRPDYCAGGGIAESSGWADEDGLRGWVQAHPGRAYIVGNELECDDPVGDDLSAQEYAQWYRDAYFLIKSVDPTAKVGLYGPVGSGSPIISKGILEEVWTEYGILTGQPMPADFYPVHHYTTVPYSGLSNEIARLTEWINWMESRRDIQWTGPKEYWLTEYGLPAWEQEFPESIKLSFMADFTMWLLENPLNITCWAWWPAYPGIELVRGGERTSLGDLYYSLSAGLSVTGGTQTMPIHYGTQAVYDSGWIPAHPSGGNYFYHNLGASPVSYIVLAAADGSGTAPTESQHYYKEPLDGKFYGRLVWRLGTDLMVVKWGDGGLGYSQEQNRWYQCGADYVRLLIFSAVRLDA